MPVLTTETRLTEKEAHDIMGYIQKYRVDTELFSVMYGL